MGFFNNLAKLGEEIKNSEAMKGIKDSFKDMDNDLRGSSIVNTNTIPEKYVDFPKFEGTLTSVKIKDENNYERCTMQYENINISDYDNYLNVVTNAGYEKKTKVRYEKGNTYIIIDVSNNHLELVYHIKK